MALLRLYWCIVVLNQLSIVKTVVDHIGLIQSVDEMIEHIFVLLVDVKSFEELILSLAVILSILFEFWHYQILLKAIVDRIAL